MELAIKQHLSAIRHAVITKPLATVKAVVPFQVNKFIRMGLSAFGWLLGILIALDWTAFLTPEKAGALVAILCGIKFLYNLCAPGFGVSTIATDSKIITQKAVE